MSVWIKHKTGNKYTVFAKHKGKRTSSTVVGKANANKLKEELELTISRGERDLESLGKTFDSVARMWLETYVRGSLGESTYQRYEGLLRNYILPHMGSTPIRKIGRPKIRETLIAMKSSMSSMDSAKNVISGVFEFAINDGILPTGSNSALGAMSNIIPSRKVTKAPIEVFTKEEFLAIIEAVKIYRPSFYPLFLMLFRTGMRLGEALALDWSDMNYTSGYIFVSKSWRNGIMGPTKTKVSRKVDMSDFLIQEMEVFHRSEKKRLLKDGATKDITGPIFKATDNTRLSQNSARNVWKKSLEKAGINYKKVHLARHTYASFMLTSEASITYVSKQLGHANISMTVDTYGHMIPDQERGAVNFLDGVFGQRKRSTQNKKPSQA